MYSLDINFLNDRPEIKPDKRRSPKAKVAIDPSDRRPLFLGFGTLVFFPAIAAALLGILTLRNGDLERQQADLDTQLGNLESEKKNLDSIRSQAQKAIEETQALATVFNQIKPWSAMAQDIRDRLPSTVQLVGIKQVDPKDQVASSSTSGTQKPVSGLIEIDGIANTFNDVNDFLLTLQRSSFLKSNETKLVSAELGDEKTLQLPEFPGLEKSSNSELKPPKLPRRVTFKLQTALSDVPASELVRELNRKGAIGLVTRIEALKDRGVIQTESSPATPPNGATQPNGATKP
jgi:type IV pilus assembly protein PilN